MIRDMESYLYVVEPLWPRTHCVMINHLGLIHTKSNPLSDDGDYSSFSLHQTGNHLIKSVSYNDISQMSMSLNTWTTDGNHSRLHVY